MKVSPSIKIRCEGCKLVIRRKKGKSNKSMKPRRFIICKKNPRALKTRIQKSRPKIQGKKAKNKTISNRKDQAISKCKD